MNKIYIRKGRRFMAVPNVVGMFYDGVNFTKERNSSSFAFCYNQNGNTAMLVFLNVRNGAFTWHRAHEDCIKPYHLPSREQILLVRTKYESLFNNFCLAGDIIWTYDVVENSYTRAWGLRWNNGYVGSYYKDNPARVILFFETEIV